MADTEPAIPSISVRLAITPPEYSRQTGDAGFPTFTIVATLAPSAPKPITLMTWPTAFNPQLALKRRDFTAQNISRDPPEDIRLEITKGPSRLPYQPRRGSSDQRYYVTLYPGRELTIAEQPFNLVKRVDGEGVCIFQPGNTYRLGISDSGSKTGLWWWGTTDDILYEAGGPPYRIHHLKGKGDISLISEPVDFTIVE
ncbi:hypothetical protein PFICI_09405 [Pestalotiopsis fici W106-1]|uniref:Uncharacterized protein n=1 Tax=Pestalotiopsis fici (strain W106-1 / CGMCC3.15140) TaxID=1229662 RepID=W3X2D3_PESFW|nr:uncharacterized protein PFICI_09405 [Pestalotiopsis fici W106-1]ETS79552.1 hypothetical protein PFICI_09405 [Pestalotiopsis fici W106-1]